jgi:acetoin utilization protein AcuC
MTDRCSFVFSEDLLNYKFNSNHPFNQFRLKLTVDLLHRLKALGNHQIVPPRMASEEELALVHDPSYIDAVKMAGHGQLPQHVAENYGIGTEDTPIFPNMHEASALLVGGTLTAVDQVMTGQAVHALPWVGDYIMDFEGKLLDFVFIMIVQ